MANKIQRLDEDSVRQIAAGEVVERPASVVKELIENSIDAQSHQITLEVIHGGKEMIRVSDDGLGMTAEDAVLSLERHTTSKIRAANDLETLSTFGFRGEALPSISSVSKMELITRSADESHGISFSLVGGKLVLKKECGRSIGTTMEIKELFFNVPARLKFLKSEASEKNRIVRTFEEIAIAHPHISFQLKQDHHKIKEFPSREESLQRVNDLWGDDFIEENLIPISFQHPSIRIEGWISKPQSHQPTKSYQIFYVNNRPIISRFISHALYESYRDCLPTGRHPVAILFFTLEPSQIDVNVHPSKREVRFRNESQIYQALIQEIRLKRSQLSSPPKIFSMPFDFKKSDISDASSSVTSQETFSSIGSTQDFRQERTNLNRIVESHSTALPPFSSSQTDARREKQQEVFEDPKHLLAQFNSLYMIAEQGENLLIVDQHAAAERILYEQFKEAILSQGSVPTQPLLIPILWEISFSQAELIKNALPSLHKLGFMLEVFGEKTFRIKEAPANVPESGLKETLDEILSSLENGEQPTLTMEEKIMRSACRAALKANDPTSLKELSQILKQLSQCNNPHTCPHGRPITLTMSRQELDKKFGRK